MLRSRALTLAVAIVFPIGCGSASEDALFGPPNPDAWTGPRPSSGGAKASGGGGSGSGGVEASGGTSAGGTGETGGTSAGGVSTGGTSQSGAGGMDPSTGGSATEIGSPGVVACAGIPCRTDTSPSTSTCCLRPFPPFQTYCRPEAVICSSIGASGIHCDDAADCGGGALCCASIENSLATSKCGTSRCGSSGSAQLCRTNAECPDGSECKPWEKFPEYDACQ